MSRRLEDINEHMDPDTTQRDFPTTQPDFVSSSTLPSNMAGMVAARHGTTHPEHSRTLCGALTNTGVVGALGGAAKLEATLQYSRLTRFSSRSCFVDCPDGYGLPQPSNLRMASCSEPLTKTPSS
ncbi:hypothetical protein N7491_008577 [Penicillium cf. griseofulvum]|uniref:Uncharacterized protein n=1 Tax=Penicillium cf. griseofulvum TaxID=2972120 RepID=A0A9W9MG36_9EURO|nr:hypothetical protein N7472_005821 [Penicillium cf. griseofulvum]KAJ5423361.1 hypothetical protein N7491_008577 [Penicillium cf. griseofulvum]